MSDSDAVEVGRLLSWDSRGWIELDTGRVALSRLILSRHPDGKRFIPMPPDEVNTQLPLMLHITDAIGN